METKALKLIFNALEKRIEGLKEMLAIGNVGNIEDYRLIVGTVRGLAYAQSEINDLLRSMKENDED